MTDMLQAVNPNRFVCALEGGYDLETTANCVEAVVRILLVRRQFLSFFLTVQGENTPSYKHALPSAPAMIDMISCIAFQREHWKCIANLEVSCIL